MKTKPFQTLLKVWITVASLAAFLFGWIVLGHSGKPVSSSALSSGAGTTDTGTTTGASTTNLSSQLAPLPTLVPLTNTGSSTSLQTLPQVQAQVQQPSFNFTPRLRTRGS